ncbi:MAG: hypothetical protein ACXADL_13680 [Candidatus Thorarchaeota archaeon]|jgi:hypothetical protein
MTLLDPIQWLFINAGPVLKFRTLVDLIREKNVGLVASALEDLLLVPEVKHWLTLLEPKFELNDIHSSRQHAYENVMGKLVQLGLRAGMQLFDSKTLPFRVWLSENTGQVPEKPHSVFLHTILASFLALAGYGTTSPVKNHLNRRLDSLFHFAKNPDFENIFVDKSDSKGLLKSQTGHRFINPDLHPDQQFRLPWIHDIRGIVNCSSIMDSKSKRKKAERVVEMVLSPEYQDLPQSYGLARYGKKHYVVGWSVHLPGHVSAAEGREFAEMLLTMEMLAPFNCVRKSVWFRKSLGYLKSFKTEFDTYSFPRAWLPEKKNGYWVSGTRMAYDKRAGKPNAVELESTFRYMRICRLAGIY